MSRTAGYRSAIENYIREQARPVDKYGHQPRLYALTQQVGAGLEYDDDVVHAAAWLHDLGVFIGHRIEDPIALAQWDHVAYTLARAPGILSDRGFPDAKVPGVLDAIRMHLPSSDPTSIESTILRDADILEQLGAVGILRAVVKTGRDARYPDFTTVVEWLRRAAMNLPALLRLETSKALAAPKLRILEAFLAQADAEARPGLY